LAESEVDIRAGADPALVQRERQLRAELTAVAARLAPRIGTRLPEPQRARLAKKLRDTQADHEQVLARLRETSPRYAALVQPPALGIAELQSQLLEPDTALLEYALGEERSYVWVVTSSSIVWRE